MGGLAPATMGGTDDAALCDMFCTNLGADKSLTGGVLLLALFGNVACSGITS